MQNAAQTTAALNIVIVEDDAVVRQFLKDTIEQLGHHIVGEAATGADMVRTVLSVEPDIVVFDIHLPGLNGLDALRQIYQERIVAAVAVTADRDQDLVRRALEEHVLAYLVKPIEAHQIGPALMVAKARFGEWRSLQEENENLRKTLENRKTIERAKGVLMKRHRWSEAEAFRRLQRARHESAHHDGGFGAECLEWRGNRTLSSAGVCPKSSRRSYRTYKPYRTLVGTSVEYHTSPRTTALYRSPKPSTVASLAVSPTTLNPTRSCSLGKTAAARSAHSTRQTPSPSKYSCTPRSLKSLSPRKRYTSK